MYIEKVLDLCSKKSVAFIILVSVYILYIYIYLLLLLNKVIIK